MHVFAYGTLTFPEVWQLVVGRSFESMQGRLTGFTAYRFHAAAYPGIVAATAADSVDGVVYLDVASLVLQKLDQFEDDWYRRQAVQVQCADGRQRHAFAYVIPNENRHVLSGQLWNAQEFVAAGHLERMLARLAPHAHKPTELAEETDT